MFSDYAGGGIKAAYFFGTVKGAANRNGRMDTHRLLLHCIYAVVYTAVSQTSMCELPNKHLTDNCLETQRYGIRLSNSPQTYRIKRFGVWIYVL